MYPTEARYCDMKNEYLKPLYYITSVKNYLNQQP